MSDLTSEIKTLARHEGMSLIGIASAINWKVPRGHKPSDVLPDAKSVIVMAKQVADKVIDDAPTAERENDGKAIGK